MASALLARLREPSTWAALATAFASGSNADDPILRGLCLLGAGLAVILGVAIPERK